MNFFIAQSFALIDGLVSVSLFLGAGGLDAALGKGLGIIAKIAFLSTVVLVMMAGYKVKGGNDTSEAKNIIIGAVIVGCSSLIAEAIFQVGDLAGSVIKPQF